MLLLFETELIVDVVCVLVVDVVIQTLLSTTICYTIDPTCVRTIDLFVKALNKYPSHYWTTNAKSDLG